LRKLGEKRALLTVHTNNIPSIKVIERNGGRLEDKHTDPETGKQLGRYWIELEPQLPPSGDAEDHAVQS